MFSIAPKSKILSYAMNALIVFAAHEYFFVQIVRIQWIYIFAKIVLTATTALVASIYGISNITFLVNPAPKKNTSKKLKNLIRVLIDRIKIFRINFKDQFLAQ
jgi:hypothetical protein